MIFNNWFRQSYIFLMCKRDQISYLCPSLFLKTSKTVRRQTMSRQKRAFTLHTKHRALFGPVCSTIPLHSVNQMDCTINHNNHNSLTFHGRMLKVALLLLLLLLLYIKHHNTHSTTEKTPDLSYTLPPPSQSYYSYYYCYDRKRQK